jgi:hypothetical protein
MITPTPTPRAYPDTRRVLTPREVATITAQAITRSYPMD